MAAGLMLCGLLMVALPACGGDEESQSFAGTRWVLTTYRADGSLQTALPSPLVKAKFSGGRVTGTGGCNRYFGPYQVDGQNLSVGLLASTRRACEPPIMDQETTYLKDLQSAGSYEISKGTLVIKDAAGATVLEFRSGSG